MPPPFIPVGSPRVCVRVRVEVCSHVKTLSRSRFIFLFLSFQLEATMDINYIVTSKSRQQKP